MFPGYMKLYNAAGLSISIAALVLTISHVKEKLHSQVLKIGMCQTFFILELLNIAIGKSKSTILPTIVQLSSRLIIIWPICYKHEKLTRSLLFNIMCIAWYVSDTIRYVFYLFRVKWAKWLRYNLFIILYPIGITIEMWLAYNALKNYGKAVGFLAKGIILLWTIGFIFLYYHMLKQRKYANKKKLVKRRKAL